MRFKNFRTTPIRACSNEGHSIYFKPFEEMELPQHLELFAIEKGLVPLDDVEAIAAREAEQAAAEQAAADEAAKESAAAKRARTIALKKAAEADASASVDESAE